MSERVAEESESQDINPGEFVISALIVAIFSFFFVFYFTHSEPAKVEPKKELTTQPPKRTITIPGIVNSDYEYLFSKGGINLFQQAGPSLVVGKISQPGATVTVLDESGNWMKVDFNGVRGWASKRLLTNSY